MTALVVSARYDRRKGRRHKTFTDYAQQMLVCLRRWLPDRDLVVVADGGTPSASSCGIARVCQSRLSSSPNCARTRPCTSPRPRRPGQIGRPRVVGARHCPVPRRCWTIPLHDSLPATGSDGSTAMVELASGVALWYHGGPPRLPIRWVVIRYLEERMLCYAPTPRRNPSDIAVVSAAVAGR